MSHRNQRHLKLSHLVLLGACGTASAVAAAIAARAQTPPKPQAAINLPGPVLSVNASVTISVDATSNRHVINPLIYGSNFASVADLTALNLPLNRSGGNNTSRYNWNLNADNRASDYYFESLDAGSATPGAREDTFMTDTQSKGAQPMLTIPMVGYVANLGAGRAKLASFSIAKYGAQQDSDWQWFPDAGNGVKTTGVNITGNDPLDANVAADQTFQKNWVQHLVAVHGTASTATGLRYYLLDNEPSIWHSTHRDVHPAGASMDEMRDKMIAYSEMIKSVDPAALVVGPEEWGWSGYFLSGQDQKLANDTGNYSNYPDKAAHGNMDYLPYLLDQLRQRHALTGRRVLDVFTVHYYPQGGEFSEDLSSTMQTLRNKSTRSLWDPAYVDTSWISDKVMLIPRLRSWVNTYYPGTKIGITEYNWGAETSINGATTQADIWGIFGRENLDLATRWTTPASTSPVYQAMKLYRNYDNNKSTFGDNSVAASSSVDANNLSTFAALRSSDHALTVMVVNKVLSGASDVTVNLANFSAGSTAQVWQINKTTPTTITHLANVTVTNNSLTLAGTAAIPAQSITLLVIPEATTTAVNITVPVTLQSYAGNTASVPLSVELRQPGSTTPLETWNATLSGGVLTVSTKRQGTFDLAIKGAPFLRKTIKNISVTASGASLSAVTLLNGDASADNQVTSTDISMVNKAMGSTSGGAGWNPAADLNGDGVVNSTDKAIAQANNRQNGDL